MSLVASLPSPLLLQAGSATMISISATLRSSSGSFRNRFTSPAMADTQTDTRQGGPRHECMHCESADARCWPLLLLLTCGTVAVGALMGLVQHDERAL